MSDNVIEETRQNIELLNIDSSVRKNILEVYDNYSKIVKKFYDNAYERTCNKDISNATDYLKQAINMFLERLNSLLNDKNDILIYLSYIKNNLDMFDDKKLLNESRNNKERMLELYERISTNTFNKNFYEEVLTYSSKTLKVLTSELYALARYMGYTDDAEDSLDMAIYEDTSDDIKQGIKLVM